VRTIRIERIPQDQAEHCAYCHRKIVFRWQAVDGRIIWACVWHTRKAWRELDWRRNLN
jgi:hypothetical protein